MDITKLASLARIKLSPEEAESLSKEFEGILAYVDQIKKLDLSADKSAEFSQKDLLNIMREDDNANINGAMSSRLVSLSPESEGDYVKVKKIL